MSTTSAETNYAEPVVDSTPHPPPDEPAQPAAAPTGVWEWFTRRRTLRAARRLQVEGSRETLALRERARETALVADRLFDAVEPVSAATGQALAADLYRQSVLWSLAARAPAELQGASAEQLWDATGASDLLALPGERAEHAPVIEAVARHDFRAFSQLEESQRQRIASHLRTLAHSALELASPGERAVQTLLFQRFVRSLLALVLLAGLLTLGVIVAGYLGRKPNLAAGKPWRASSEWAKCQPEIRMCGPIRTQIFFHTLEDAQPWIEFDLLAPTTFSEVFVRNRTDSVPDRVLPLVVEVSDDAKAWRIVSRRDDSFRTWTATFPSVTARYVRLRIDRRSYLHLEAVEVRP